MSSPDPSTLPTKEVMMQIMVNVLLARTLSVAAELGLADLVSDTPKSARELATATGAHENALYRLLRMLASHGVFAEDEHGHFSLTPLAAVLRSEGDDALRNYFRLSWQDVMWDTYRELLHPIMTGEPAFDRAHGMAVFDYLAAHPDVNARFDAMMALRSAPENAIIAQAYNFGQFDRIVDVAGGRGGFLAAVLRTYPTVHGVLYDQPQVVIEPTELRTAGVLDRCDIIGGDFFASVPTGGDVYVLKWILHDWDDARAVAILRRCRDAMGQEGRVLTIDAVIRPGNEADPNKNMDVIMMAMSQGRERTEDDFRTLYEQAGLRLTRVTRTSSPSALSIVEGVRTSSE